MIYPERFSNLPDYAFPRLRKLLDDTTPGGPVIHMSIGEPRHPFPDWLGDELARALAGFAKYPANNGTPALLQAISDWIVRRYGVTLDPDTQIMAVNGTREGLYNAAMALCPGGAGAKVLTPNPFYQVYAVAALSVGAEPVYVPATRDTGFMPDFRALPASVLNATQMVYICSPSNPQGAVASAEYWADLLDLAETYDFRILADECYAEIYRNTPPPGALEVAAAKGADPERVVVFHSLSKRSNVPGLRSGFVAGGPKSIARIRQLRAYAGAPLPEPLQAVSARLWADDTHVVENRALYAEKYAMADQVFAQVPGYDSPQAGFFLWLPVEDGEAAAQAIWRNAGVRVLPGAYLARDVAGENPGHSYIRVALVAPKDETRRGLNAIHDTLYAGMR